MEDKQNWTEQRRGRMGLPFQAKYTLFAKAYGAWLPGGTKELSVATARRTLRKGKGGDRQSGLVRPWWEVGSLYWVQWGDITIWVSVQVRDAVTSLGGIRILDPGSQIGFISYINSNWSFSTAWITAERDFWDLIPDWWEHGKDMREDRKGSLTPWPEL